MTLQAIDKSKQLFSSSQVPDGSIWLEVCCDKISRASQASVMTTSDVQSAFLAEGIQGPLGGLPTRIKKFLHNFELDQKRGPGGILAVFFDVLECKLSVS